MSRARTMLLSGNGDQSIAAGGYENFGPVSGTSGYGIRDNAGTMEYKNAGGAWAPIATAAGTAGGWTDDGLIVRLDTGTDSVAIGGTTSITSRFFSSATTGNIFNDAGADIDFRIESDTNANHFTSDSGVFGGVGAFCFGRAVNTAAYVSIDPPAYTGAAADNIHRLNIGSLSAITVGTGTTPTANSLRVDEPNILLNGNVVTNAYSVYISGAPTEGVNNGALWVGAGQVRFSSMATSAAGLPSGTLWNNAGVVNIV